MCLKLFLSFFLILLSHATWATATTTDSLLSALNQALAQRQQYDAQRLSRIAFLRAEYTASHSDPEAQFRLSLRIYDEYKAYKYDSAFAYCLRINRLADQSGDAKKVALAKLKLSFILLSSGMFKETFEALDHLKAKQLSAADQIAYYFLKARAYSDLGTFDQDEYYRPLN
ncbi:MAG: hypothetical protein EOO62_23240, partial [Hymenobacter sp.]